MIKTSHTLLELNKNQRKQLDLICDLYIQAKHFGFKLIAKDNHILFSSKLKKKEIVTTLSSENKKLLATKFNLTGRHVNSINIELGMIISSYMEQRNNHLSDLNYNIAQIKKSIAKYNKLNQELEAKLDDLKDSKQYIQKQTYEYQQFIIDNKSKKLNNKNRFVFNYKDSNLPTIIKISSLKILLLNERYKHVDHKLLTATQTYGKNLYQVSLLNKKLQRLQNKISKIEKDINNGKLRICFGTKQLFKQQSITNNRTNLKYNSKSILYKDHIDWLTSWYDARSHQFLLTGAGEEVSSNQNCQAKFNGKGLFDIQLRVPDSLINKSLRDSKTNKFLNIMDIDFGKNNSLLKSSLLSEIKEVRVLTVAEKEEIKILKNNLFNFKKQKFELIKKNNLAKKTITNLNQDKFNSEIASFDNGIIKLQKEIEIKSDIFSFDNNISSNKKNDIQEEIRTRKKKIAIPITYRFTKNIDRKSPKYGKWSIHFTVEVKEPEIFTDISLGAIGIDLNANHLAVSEINSKGNLIQSFNIHFNSETYNNIDKNIKFKIIKPLKQLKLINSNNQNINSIDIVNNQFKFSEKTKSNLSEVSSNKTQNILGNALKIITDLSLKTGKPIVIEKLDFTQKKRQLAEQNKYKINKFFNYNHMISSFAYSKFKELLKSQATNNGCEVIEVNPAYSSLIGVINYVKPLGLSVHMAASYVIAQRGLKLNKKLNNYQIDEKPRIIKNNKLEIYTKSKVYLVDYIVNSSLSEDKLNNKWNVISNLYKTLQQDIYKENLQHKKLALELKSNLKSSKDLSNELDLSYLFS